MSKFLHFFSKIRETNGLREIHNQQSGITEMIPSWK